MKKSLMIVLSLLLCLAAALALAEGAENAGAAEPDPADGLKLEMIMQYMPDIAQAANMDYVIVTEKFTHYKSLYTSAGEKLTTIPYPNLASAGYGCFVAYDAGDEINNRVLVTDEGAELATGCGDYKLYSARWAVGYILTPAASEEAYDYKRGGELFNIEQVHVYYLDQEAGTGSLVGTLAREQFASADVHGDFFAVMDASEQVSLYGKDFTKYDYPMAKVSDAVYKVVDYAVINAATGEMVLDGFTDAKEQKMSNGLWLLVTRYNFKGQKISGLIDTQGNEILPVEYTISSVADQYVVLSNEEGLKGLYSLATGKLIVPCEFSSIIVGKVSTDNYVHDGYVAVEQGDYRGYYDTRAGRISCDVKYDRSAVTTVGCSTFWQVEEGVYMLVAADGVETQVHVDAIANNTRGNGKLLLAQKDGMFGLIDWHGNVVLPFEHFKAVLITDDSRAIIRTSTGLRIDRILEQ